MATQEIEGSGPQVDHYTPNIEEFESVGPIDVHIAEQILNAISQMGELYFSLMSGGFKNQSETQK